ncbi:GmrSD restriction endonuclease domain-containing protein [Spiroplasma endosymbiont of Labia minor]|uniref:GmrSD restriction endonuclease domain-containing protein n=1 Tax=Spiroplasma endosymbiont of Labia minor TaxID=3066305 RepID=UPI0030D0D9AF
MDSNLFKCFKNAEFFFNEIIDEIENNNWYNIEYLKKIKNSDITFLICSFLFVFDFSRRMNFGIFQIDDIKYIVETFQNINSRGKQLSAFDYLKNEIYQLIKDDESCKSKFSVLIEEIENLIVKTYGSVESADYLLDIFKSMYLNTLEIGNVKEVNKSNVVKYYIHNLLKKKFLNNPITLLEHIKKYLENYLEIFPKSYFSESVSKLDNDYLETLNVYKMIKSANISILKVMLVGMKTCIDIKNDGKNVMEINQLSLFIKRLSYVYIINLNLYNKRPNWHDNKLREIMHSFSSKLKIDKIRIEIEKNHLNLSDDYKDFLDVLFEKKHFNKFINKFVEVILKHVDNDEEEILFFSDNCISKFILQDFYFSQLNEERDTFLNTEYNLEHLIPQKNKDTTLEEKYNKYELKKIIYSIGNMILLPPKSNTKISNKNIKEKLKIIFGDKYNVSVLTSIEEKVFANQSIKELYNKILINENNNDLSDLSFDKNEVDKREKIILGKLISYSKFWS